MGAHPPPPIFPIFYVLNGNLWERTGGAAVTSGTGPFRAPPVGGVYPVGSGVGVGRWGGGARGGRGGGRRRRERLDAEAKDVA